MDMKSDAVTSEIVTDRKTKREMIAQCEQVAEAAGQFILGPEIETQSYRFYKKHGFRAKLGHARALRLAWMGPVGSLDIDEPRRSMEAISDVRLVDIRTEGSKLIMVLRSASWEKYLACEAPDIDPAMYAEYRGTTKKTARFVGRAPFARTMGAHELRRHMPAFEDAWRPLYFFVQVRMLSA